jgi:triacylglycerol lipase
MEASRSVMVSAANQLAGQNWYDLPPKDWEHLFYPQQDYQYFREPRPFPDATDAQDRSQICTATTAAWMADAAVLAYDRSGENRIPPLAFDAFLGKATLKCHLIGDWGGTAKGTQGYFAYNPNFAVLSFRGTEKSDWTDLLADISTLPVKEDWSSRLPTQKDKTLFHVNLGTPLPFLSADEIGVHAGFQFALNSVWDEVKNWVDDYHRNQPNSPIFFTGHSLGAALATLAIARFDGIPAALYTFGSPRVGNAAFCKKVESKAPLGIYRIVDNQDFVTTVPPRDHAYDQTGGLVLIDPAGNVQTSGIGPQDCGLFAIAQILSTAALAAVDSAVGQSPPSALADHSPTRYCYFLWRAARNGKVP